MPRNKDGCLDEAASGNVPVSPLWIGKGRVGMKQEGREVGSNNGFTDVYLEHRSQHWTHISIGVATVTAFEVWRALCKDSAYEQLFQCKLWFLVTIPYLPSHIFPVLSGMVIKWDIIAFVYLPRSPQHLWSSPWGDTKETFGSLRIDF